jgi:hypothetical protein
MTNKNKDNNYGTGGEKEEYDRTRKLLDKKFPENAKYREELKLKLEKIRKEQSGK